MQNKKFRKTLGLTKGAKVWAMGSRGMPIAGEVVRLEQNNVCVKIDDSEWYFLHQDVILRDEDG
jgi:hypothetical protein